MLSRLLFNLTAVFLIFYISASSATPAAELAGSQKIDNSIDDNSAISVIPAADPAELQNIDNNIDNNIHDRAYRARPYRPYFCQYPYVWQRRECVPSVGPRAWQDVCTHATYATRFEVDYQNIRGLCAENTWCTNIVDEEGKRFVRCVLMAPGKRRREGPQIGASDRKRARPTLDNTQLEFSVKIEDDMKAASVGAVVESDDGTFIVSPNNVIVGKIHGKEIEVCKGDKSDSNKARECYPKKAFNLKKGDIIDYTWGMTNDQEGTLLFGIIPS